MRRTDEQRNSWEIDILPKKFARQDILDPKDILGKHNPVTVASSTVSKPASATSTIAYADSSLHLLRSRSGKRFLSCLHSFHHAELLASHRMGGGGGGARQHSAEVASGEH